MIKAKGKEEKEEEKVKKENQKLGESHEDTENLG